MLKETEISLEEIDKFVPPDLYQSIQSAIIKDKATPIQAMLTMMALVIIQCESPEEFEELCNFARWFRSHHQKAEMH